jgi:alpha-beta hydrolase superfamily lysophospholipase
MHLRRAFAIMRAGGAVEEYVSAVAPLQQYPALRALGITTGSTEDYLRWQNSMDYLYRPDTALRELRQPTLILFGENDALIDWRDSVHIYQDSFKAAGNANLTVKVFHGTDHDLMAAGSDSQPVAGYLQTMTQWLSRHAGK